RIEVLRVLNDKQIELKDFNIKPEVLAEIVKRVEDKKFSTTQAREIFDYIANNNVNLDGAIKACGVVEGGAVTGDALLDAIRNIIKANPDVVEEIKSGKDTKGKKMKFLQGLVMKETKGQAKPQELPDIINKLLAE
ncbi:MAG: Asp-tRNA(Asn)/Glu-tRNA(Gln) amidotransferase GatCAB subunit B, partial [Synergistaceae bacterium]|nr:Asp-tRNA(Asn)/Glu-tRNA(Gln) amidotransferase GatCAB subunit B [Synergistaceae bacterium]